MQNSASYRANIDGTPFGSGVKSEIIPSNRNHRMLNFETTLHLEEREKVIQQRIERYFEEQGYQAKLDTHNQRYYERGSEWRNYIAMNPGNWHVFARIQLHTTNDQSLWAQVRLDVDTQGQIVLDRERQYWETEFDVLTTFLETGKSKRDDILGQLGKRNQWQNMAIMAGVVVVSALCSAVFVFNAFG
jgi:hypothetical protein